MLNTILILLKIIFPLMMTSGIIQAFHLVLNQKTNELSIIGRKTDCVILETRVRVYPVSLRFTLLPSTDTEFLTFEGKIFHQQVNYKLALLPWSGIEPPNVSEICLYAVLQYLTFLRDFC